MKNQLQKEIIDGSDWLLQIDPENKGKNEEWYKKIQIDSLSATVPGSIQNVFKSYHGVAWYYKDQYIFKNSASNGRYLLHFKAVDYIADVWVNGIFCDNHCGAETPFYVDITAAVQFDQINLICIRVLNPTEEPIDGITIDITPSGVKSKHNVSNSTFNNGGVTDSVSLIYTGDIFIKDIYALPDYISGKVKISLIVDAYADLSAEISVKISSCREKMKIITENCKSVLKTGENIVELEATVLDHKLWSPDDPYLYNIKITAESANFADIQNVKIGFRDFRFSNGHLMLNGKRFYIKAYNFLPHYPGTYTVPTDKTMIEKDIVNMKLCGFNGCRCGFGFTTQHMMDMFDQYGIIAFAEHGSSWQLADKGRGKEVFLESLTEVIKRDRNHPSIVAWGFSNELRSYDPVFQYAIDSLVEVRKLDRSRLCLVNSGRHDGIFDAGGLSNPESDTWDVKTEEFVDIHMYIEQDPAAVKVMRGALHNYAHMPMFFGERSQEMKNAAFMATEWGNASAVDYPAALRNFTRLGMLDNNDEADYYKQCYSYFLDDWKYYEMEDLWTDPDNYFYNAQKFWLVYRSIQETATRSNPKVIGSAACILAGDQGIGQGDGVCNSFREEKPGAFEAMKHLNDDVRWCVMTEPYNISSGQAIKIEALLTNLDVLDEGKYGALVQIYASNKKPVYEKYVNFDVTLNENGEAAEYVIPVFDEELTCFTDEGEYSVNITLSGRENPPCGNVDFYVFNDKKEVITQKEIVYVGDDENIKNWIQNKNIKLLPLDEIKDKKNYLILQSGDVIGDKALLIDQIMGLVESGSKAIFLDQLWFSDGTDATAYLPLSEKGKSIIPNWCANYFRADYFAKKHPIFKGLPTGFLNPKVYRLVGECSCYGRYYERYVGGVVSKMYFTPLTRPDETICAAVRTSANYTSGICVGRYNHGKGSFLLNTLRIKEFIGIDPVASRLLSNMLEYYAD